MKIAAVQMVSEPDLGANLLAARRLLEAAAAQGAQLAALPEYFCLMGQQDSDKLLEYYVTKECKPETCGQAPFQIAGKLCPAGFRAHYLPFPKTATPPMPVK